MINSIILFFVIHHIIKTAIFYALSSLAVIFVNKVILSEFGFPHFLFLAGCQFLATSLILGIINSLKLIELPTLSRSLIYDVFPISIMFFANVVTGLGSTKALNLPMFTALRRFSIWMTMIGEWTILGKEPTRSTSISVALMLSGAIIAAFDDLTFELHGYLLVLGNNLFTALNGIYLKRATLNGRYGKLGILYYNSLLSGCVVLLIYLVDHISTLNSYAYSSGTTTNSFFSQISSSMTTTSTAENDNEFPLMMSEVSTMLREIIQFNGWSNPIFLLFFFLGTAMGSILNYSMFLCTHFNSALTTTVVGCLKNVITTYVGMLMMSGYSFTWTNFLGLNLSIMGSLYYTYVSLIIGGYKEKDLSDSPAKDSGTISKSNSREAA